MESLFSEESKGGQEGLSFGGVDEEKLLFNYDINLEPSADYTEKIILEEWLMELTIVEDPIPNRQYLNCTIALITLLATTAVTLVEIQFVKPKLYDPIYYAKILPAPVLILFFATLCCKRTNSTTAQQRCTSCIPSFKI